MSWTQLDDKFPSHPKSVRIGPLGRDLFVCGLCYCNEYLTDGFIPDDMVPHLAPGQARPAKVVALLLEVGLWERASGRDGFMVHDYHDWNPTAASAKAAKKSAKDRKDRWRERQRERRGNAVPVASQSRPGNADGNGDGTPTETGIHSTPLHSAPEEPTTSGGLRPPVDGAAKKPAAKRPESGRPPADVTALVTGWAERFEKAVGERPAIAWERHGGMAKKLLTGHTLTVCLGLLDAFFASDDEFIAKAGRDFSVFAGQFNKLLGQRNGSGRSGPALSPKTAGNAQAARDAVARIQEAANAYDA